MPAYVPPHLRGKVLKVSPNKTRRIRFVGNATGALNVVSSKGKRFTPKRHAVAGKKTLKAVRLVTPNAKPLWEPSHALRKAAPKFAAYALARLGYGEWRKPGKKRKTKKTKRGAKN